VSADAQRGEPAIESSLEDLYEHAPCGYLSTTVDGAIVRVNDTLLSWTGYRRSDLIGRAFVSVMEPGSQLLFETRYRSVLHLRGEAKQVTLTLRTASGEALPVLINGVVITDEDGRPRAIRAAIFDARQRQEYERELLSARRLAEASETRVRVLQNASSTFSAVTTEAALADRLAHSTREAFAASQVSVYLLDDGGSLDLVSGEPALGLPALSEDGPAAALLGDLQGTVVCHANTAAESPELAAAMRGARMETLASAPLLEEGTPFGLLIGSFRRARVLDGTDIELLEALALQAAHVLTRLRLQRQLEHLALYDQLTGLASRRLVHRLLVDAVSSTQQSESALALIFVDLDGFKTINDEFGHAAGDGVLREIGARLSAAVRQGDSVGRLGGDEFVVICADVGPEAVDRVVERLHAALREPLAGPASGIPVTCSIGVAIYSGRTQPPPEVMIERADAAMYESKRAGKNRTTTVLVEDSPVGEIDGSRAAPAGDRTGRSALASSAALAAVAEVVPRSFRGERRTGGADD
jgi:diguanylate cyclase (GGDEF)-like protein/PAS domain S-box-containing protein